MKSVTASASALDYRLPKTFADRLVRSAGYCPSWSVPFVFTLDYQTSPTRENILHAIESAPRQMSRTRSPTLGILLQPFIASEDMPASVATKPNAHEHRFNLDFPTTTSLPLGPFEVDLNVFTLD